MVDIVYALADAVGVTVVEGPMVAKTEVVKEIVRRGGKVFGFKDKEEQDE